MRDIGKVVARCTKILREHADGMVGIEAVAKQLEGIAERAAYTPPEHQQPYWLSLMKVLNYATTYGALPNPDNCDWAAELQQVVNGTRE